MSGHSGASEHAPSQGRKMLANFFSGLIVGSFRILVSIFQTVFRILTFFA